MRVTIRIGRTAGEIEQARDLVARVYAQFGVRFAEGSGDPATGTEGWPHRFLVAVADGTVVGAMGLYLRDTYVERFGGVTRAQVDAVVTAAGERRGRPLRELAKLAVDPSCRGWALGDALLAAAHSRAFALLEARRPPLVLACARRSIFRRGAQAGIRARLISSFPESPGHAQARTARNPMENRVLIPEVDVSRAVFERDLPLDLVLPDAPASASRGAG
jgi:GNAT superfamily N-acetyltransferase